MNKAFIGIYTGLGSGVCLILNNKIELAISEERFTRIKNESRFPINGINQIKKILDLNSIKYSNCTVGFVDKYPSIESLTSFFNEASNFKDKSVVISRLHRSWSFGNKRLVENITNTLSNLPGAKIKIVDHHLAHASCSFSFKKDYDFAITCDGRGDLQSLVVWDLDSNKFKRILTISELSSLGFLYGQITKLLGFKPHQDEGKITGLAAYGKATNLTDKLKTYIKLNENNLIEASSDFAPWNSPWRMEHIVSLCESYNREDIAFAAQVLVEEYIVSIINSHIPSNVHLFASGGVFANVKLNQRIRENCRLKSYSVFPAMSDEGLPLGIACSLYGEKMRTKINMPFLGTKYNKEDLFNKLIKLCDENNLIAKKSKNIVNIAANLLVNNKIIGLYNGRSEFGKRSLGHRSILSQATNKNFVNELNERLNRSDFMPFAPVTLLSDSYLSYTDYKETDLNTNFMTTCYKCSDYLKTKSPAIVHVDNTARPQIISNNDKDVYAKILLSYYKLTNISTLINTSFNLHEEPIVETIEDAIRVLVSGGVDAIIVEEDYVLVKDLSIF